MSTAIAEINVGTTGIGFTVEPDKRGAYLAFPMKMSQKWVEYKGRFKDLKEYEPVIVIPGPLEDRIVLPCYDSDRSFRCWFVDGVSCYTQLDTVTGAVVAAAREAPTDKKSLLRRHAETLLLIESADRDAVYPVKAAFRVALPRVVDTMVEARKQAATATSKIPLQYRCWYDVQIFVQQHKTEKDKSYPTGRCEVKTTTPTDLARLAKLMDAAEYRELLPKTLESYRKRVEEISAKIG